MKTKQKLLTATDLDDFNKLVNDHLDDGWVVVPNTSIGYCKNAGESSYSDDRLAIVVEK